MVADELMKSFVQEAEVTLLGTKMSAKKPARMPFKCSLPPALPVKSTVPISEHPILHLRVILTKNKMPGP